jgi:hypothetical protein
MAQHGYPQELEREPVLGALVAAFCSLMARCQPMPQGQAVVPEQGARFEVYFEKDRGQTVASTRHRTGVHLTWAGSREQTPPITLSPFMSEAARRIDRKLGWLVLLLFAAVIATLSVFVLLT